MNHVTVQCTAREDEPPCRAPWWEDMQPSFSSDQPWMPPPTLALQLDDAIIAEAAKKINDATASATQQQLKILRSKVWWWLKEETQDGCDTPRTWTSDTAAGTWWSEWSGCSGWADDGNHWVATRKDEQWNTWNTWKTSSWATPRYEGGWVSAWNSQ